MRISLPDNGGRRSGSDRRQYTYAIRIPERRLIMDRRNGIERRTSTETTT